MQNSKRTITTHASVILIDNIYDLNLFYVHTQQLIDCIHRINNRLAGRDSDYNNSQARML